MTNFVPCACLALLPFLTLVCHADDTEVVKQAKKKLAGHFTIVSGESVVAFDELQGKKNWEAEAKLLKHLPKVVAFQSYSTGTTDAAFQDIGGLSEMRELRLANIPITDPALKDIGRLTKLKLLVLGNVPVTDAGLAELGNLAELERLELNNSRVTGTGFEKLKGLKKLSKVFLDGPSATDAGLRHIAALPAIYQVSLTGSKVTDRGLKEFAGAKKLGSLDLSGTQVTDAGVRLFQNVDDFRRLGLVYVRGTKVTQGTIDEIRKARGTKHYLEIFMK
jgi:hypothetical protein